MPRKPTTQTQHTMYDREQSSSSSSKRCLLWVACFNLPMNLFLTFFDGAVVFCWIVLLSHQSSSCVTWVSLSSDSGSLASSALVYSPDLSCLCSFSTCKGAVSCCLVAPSCSTISNCDPARHSLVACYHDALSELSHALCYSVHLLVHGTILSTTPSCPQHPVCVCNSIASTHVVL